MSLPIFHLITGGTPGLVGDAKIAATTLYKNFPVTLNISRQRNLHLPHRRLSLGLKKFTSKKRNVGVFFENIPASWINAVDQFVLIPNQEWVRPETQINLGQCQQIWCKTHYAEQIFRSHGFNVRYIGYTSKDRFLPATPKNYGSFIHIPGRSDLKGTNALLQAWGLHPEWPTLKVVTRYNHLLRFVSPNIEIITEHLDEATLNMLMNSAGVHICPSETEGFGHYINEALSTKAVVITTNAPPMNELVSGDFGVFVNYSTVTRQSFSERFHVDAGDLERKIESVINMRPEIKAAMGERARASYIEKNMAFELAITQAAMGIAE
jgi:glycosyltransferase involved in cell wall biosynthesis